MKHQPTEEQSTKIIHRLSRVEGQIRGVKGLIENEENCEKVIQQLAAARKALDKAHYEILSCVIESCTLSADSSEETMREIKKLLTKHA